MVHGYLTGRRNLDFFTTRYSTRIGYVYGQKDCRFTTRDEKPAVEFSWEGNDEIVPASGRGWAVAEADRIEGMLYFHGGDSSAFRATVQ